MAQDDERTCFQTTPGPVTPAQSSREMECVSNIEKTVEAELHEKYQISIRTMPAPFSNLGKTQKLWVSYRDAVCNNQYRLGRGTAAGPIAKTMCMIKITRDRISDNERFYTMSR